MISACCASWQWLYSLDVVDQMDIPKSRVDPNHITFSACVNACGRAWQWQMGLELCKADQRMELMINIR